jgi:hypothetical protein
LDVDTSVSLRCYKNWPARAWEIPCVPLYERYAGVPRENQQRVYHTNAQFPILSDQIGTAIYAAIKPQESGGKLMSTKFFAETDQINVADIRKDYNDIWSVKYASVMGQYLLKDSVKIESYLEVDINA